MKLLISVISIIIVFQFINLTAQGKSTSVQELVSLLKQKVILNNDQTNSIEKVLNDLLIKAKSSEDKSLLLSEAQRKVESYLDKRQLLKYNIIKNDWWKQVQELF